MVQTEDLDDINAIEKVLERGFIIQPPGGLLFPCGYFPLKKNNGTMFEALFCRIGVSKIISTKNSEINPDVIRELHREGFYDSILCHEDSSGKTKGKTPYNYNMIILKGHQIFPEFLIHFEVNDRKVKTCQMCSASEAKIYCKNDEMDLCEACDLKSHPNTKIYQNHQRVPINQKPVSYNTCEKHPSNPKELFCVQCKKELCISCKLVGDHSENSTELGGHLVWPIKDCFANQKDSKDNYTPQVTKMKNKINSCLLTLASKSIQLKEKFNSAEKEIKQIYERAIKKFRNFSNLTLEKITTYEISLRKKLDEQIWMDYFLRYQIDYQDPQRVIKNFFLHQGIQADIIGDIVLPDDQEINDIGGIQVTGEINIRSEKFNEKINEWDSQSAQHNPDSGYGAGKKGSKKDFQVKEFEQRKLEYLESQNKINKMSGLESEGGQNFEGNYVKAEEDIGRLLQDFLATNKNLGKKLEISFNSNKDNKYSLIESGNKIWKDLNDNLQSSDYIEQKLKGAFKGSQIINNDMAKLIYCNCQFKSDFMSLPTTKSVGQYNSKNQPEPKAFLKLFGEVTGPSLQLFKNNGNIFGGFASLAWSKLDEGSMGDTNCFLFNLNKDAKLLPVSHKTGQVVCQWRRNDGIGFGATDLIYQQTVRFYFVVLKGNRENG